MKIKPIGWLSTVADDDVRERLTTSDLTVSAVMLTAESSNTGYVYIGDRLVSTSVYGVALAAGDSITITATDFGYETGTELSLKDIWLDVDDSGDGVSVMYFQEA